MKNILQLLEKAERERPSKKAFIDEHDAITYGTLGKSARRVGSSLLNVCGSGKTVAIYLEKGINVIIAMMGIVYSRNCYMPHLRVRSLDFQNDPEETLSGAV